MKLNASLEKARTWLTELGIRTEDSDATAVPCLKVSRDDVDNLCGIGVIYDVFLDELRSAIGTNKFTWLSKDREWLYLDTF